MTQQDKKLATGITRLADGRLRVRATCRHPETGARLSRMITMQQGATVRDAERARLAAQDALRVEATSPPPQTITLGAYAEQWIAVRATRVRPRVAEGYLAVLSQRLLPQLGHLAAERIKRADVERWVGWAERQRREDGTPYSHQTLRGWWRVAVSLLRDMAAERGLVDPTARVRGPEGDRAPRRETRTLSTGELGELLEAVRTLAPHRYAEVLTLAYTGARAGELYALRWEDMDERGEQLHIRRSMARGVEQKTKTGTVRTAYLPRAVAEAIREHRCWLIGTQHPGLETGLIFPSDVGTPRTAECLHKVLAQGAHYAELTQRVTPQVLRRTFNTLLLTSGVDRVVLRSQMGHASEQMTARYAGVDLRHKKRAVNSVFGE